MLGLLLILAALCIAAKVWERWNRYHLAEIGMKRCQRCRRVLPRDEEHFAPNPNSPDGYSDICRECNLKAAQTHVLNKRIRT